MLLDYMPIALVALEIGLWTLGMVFLLNGLSELFIDIVKLGRDIWRAVFVFWYRRHKPLREEDLLGKPEQAIAVMIPCWDESAVIGRMLENTLKVINYSNYIIFVGTYPNDPATQREIDLVRERHGNVERIVCPKDGPTSKADCLNWIYEGIKHYEKDHGMTFEVVVMEDSEDILHPLTLKLFNYLIPRMDMVQIPVLPMEAPWWKFTRGTYLDEFAENHSRDLVVRELLTRNLPSAGVGTAFSRTLLRRLAETNQNRLFTIGSVTEDYDFGIKLAKLGNVRQIFARVRFVRTRRRKSWLTGRERLVQIEDHIGVREFFPDTFRAAVRQKSRWVLGITLQAWASIGWVGGFWTRYMLLRDRISLLTNQANMVANLLVPVYLGLWGYIRVFPGAYRFPPIVEPGSLLHHLLFANFGLLSWRIAVRAYYVARLYGPGQAALSPFRLVWSNVINYCATMRALRLYARHLITKVPVAWDKTDHSYPSEAELVKFRRRLGDLLLDRRFVTVSQLDSALERQKSTGQPLGAVLVELGFMDDDQLLQALGLQFSLQTTEVDPYAVDKEIISLVPRRLAVQHQIFPLTLAPSGVLVLAVDALPPAATLHALERELGRAIELRLTTQGELSFAIQRGYERLSGDGKERGGLGRMLLQQGLITHEQLMEALRRQRRAYRSLMDIVASKTPLSRDARDIWNDISQHFPEGQAFDLLVERGLATRQQLDAALDEQRRLAPRLGDILLDMDALGSASLEAALRDSR